MKEKGFRPEIERALRFITDHLAHPMTVAEVARAAHLSEFHFHRVFHAVMGEPVGRYVTRRRLELAALRLAYEGDRSVTEIALSSGYSSTSNFSKAFHAYFGCSPTRVRQPEEGLPVRVGKLTAQYGKGFRPSDLHAALPALDAEERARQAAAWDANVRFVTCDALEFACLASPGGYALTTLDATWAELLSRARQLGLCDEAADAWGMAHDSPQITAPELCRYHACVPCSPGVPLPSPLFHARRSAGRYAVFRYAGPVSDVEAAYRSIYSSWFAESSLAPDDYVPLDHYVSDAPKDGRVEMEMWLKVRPRR